MHGADTPNAGFTSQTVSLNRNSYPLTPNHVSRHRLDPK